MNLKAVFIAAIALLACVIADAQNLNFPGLAPSLSVSAAINKKWDANFLLVSKIRLGDHTVNEIQYQQQVLEIYSQASISYRLNRHWQLGAGYGFQRNNPFDDNWRNENRLVQQATLTIPFHKNKFYQRFRFEERWFSYPVTKPAFSTRARYQLGFIRQLKGDMFYWQINNEIYGITSAPRYSFIAENWLYTGLGFTVKPVGHFETGVGYNSNVRNVQHELNSLLLLQFAWSYAVPTHHKREVHPVMDARHF